MKRKYLLPITLVVCGILMLFFGVASNVGWTSVPLYKAVIAIPLVAHIAVKGIIGKRFYTIPIPLAALFLVFEKEIAELAGIDGGNLISNWIVVIAAILIFVGFAFITFLANDGKKDGKGEKITKTYTSATTKYIDCRDFSEETIECNMGACKVFFSNTSEYSGGGTLRLRVNKGSVVVCIPSDWSVEETNIDNHMGSVKVDVNTHGGDAKKLRIVGENDMGAIHIKNS